HDLVCSYEGDLTATVERECVSLEQVKKQPFEIIKAANNGETDADLLSGAGFTAYLLSDLTVKEDGSYDFDSAEPVVIGENGATEMFTDEKGYACSIALPYGTYLVRETTTPHNYKPVDDFIVRITEHNPTTPQVWRVLLDEEFEAKLKIIKQDDETKKPVLHKGTEFRIYDLDKQEYVEQVTTYPTTTVHKTFFTDEEGYLILPQNLKIGHYRIEEVTAPYGYTLNENYVEISVDSDTAYQIDPVSGDVVIEAVYENHPVKGKLKIVKQGEVLDGFSKDFVYQTENLAGAVFEVYAAEDIYTADFQKDAEGNRILEYSAGELVGTVTTDENGEAYLSDLPLGSYKIVEATAPEGFVLNGEAQTVTFTYKDQETPVIGQEAVFQNERQKVEVSVVKKDAETQATVEGAVFGLYAKEDILAHGEVIVKADTLIGKALSDENGKAVFVNDLPFGSYYIKEEAAPDGYISSDKVVEVTAEYQGQEIPVVELASEYENEPTKISVKKTDLTTGVELEGAKLTVLDQDGNIVDSWTSVKGEEHLIERLTVGETYTLREELAPYGYLKAEEITFTVEDTAEIQKVEMKDDVPEGTLIINKKGEFLEDVTLVDTIGGWISHIFEYITGALKDVTFEVYALEDIKAADGESEDYYKKDELIATITTDETGIAKLSGLPLGKYYVKEKETAEGYVLDGEIREIDLTYVDQETAEVTWNGDWQNNRQKAEVSVLKKEKDTDRVLEGAVFALSAKEDITNKDGDVVLEAGTVIEEKATGEDGKLTFEADLPIGFSYVVKETSPAPGFATTDEVQEFTFTAESSDKATVSYEFIFEDEPTVFEFTKTSLTDGKEVEGAKLTVTDENGEVVDEWVSGKEPHIIKELVVGQTYTMTEVLPAPGYVTAESIQFTVEDTAEVQKIEMKDDVTKVEISKTDIAGKELPGAKLTILDENGEVVEIWTSTEEPHYIEMLPIGKYILHEESAPEGYLIAEDVEFEVKDTGEIQKVVMKDEAEPEETPETPETPTTTVDAPKTGDHTPIAALMISSGLGLAGVIAAVVWMKARKKKQD
ncbi:MAG TPA: peptidase, partial [Candidatus Blautia faecigallinarum]|nr:peptidase [Candidatus Blautia faecigallinarum]